MERYLESTDFGDIRVVFTIIPYHNVRAVLPPLELFKKIHQLPLGTAMLQLANKIEETAGGSRRCGRWPLLAMSCHVNLRHRAWGSTSRAMRLRYGCRRSG